MSSDEESFSEETHEPWVVIQESTFANWANDKLRSRDISVNHLQKDFRDGVKLFALVEALIGQKIGRVISRKNMNYYEASGNIHIALQAVKQAGIKLVNIGAEDITRGNLKLILGLMWLLIRRFQIGSQSKLPPKKMMLAWVNAVLHPHVTVANFSYDWNDSKALKGIIEYCAPGTYPDWMNSNVSDRIGNCEDAMNTAERLFGVPLVITASNFCSPDLDELSGMTYLSYFMGVKSCGYNATLNWIQNVVSPTSVNNFEGDWNSGILICNMVTALGIDCTIDNKDPLERCKSAMEASEKHLSIKPVIDGSEMVSPHVHHIGVMAYVVWHQKKAGASVRSVPVRPPTPPPQQATPIFSDPPPIIKPTVDKQVKFSTTPKISVDMPATWPTLATVTIVADTSRAGSGIMTASANHKLTSSSINNLLISKVSDNSQHIEFTPTIKGEWLVNIEYNGVELEDSPFLILSYDVNFAILDKRGAQLSTNKYSFNVDLHEVGIDEIDVSVIYEDDVMDIDIVKIGEGVYRVTFATHGNGVYTVMTYCGGVRLPGSPFEVTVLSATSPDSFVTAFGDGLSTASTNQKAMFRVDFSADIGKKLEVVIERPNGLGHLPTNIENKHSGVIDIEYIPLENGLHSITLVYDGLPLKESPYSVMVQAKQVHVNNIDAVAYLGRKSIFQIDASEMSKGTLEIDGNLPVQNYQKVGDNIYEVTFIPKCIGSIDFSIKYNDELLKG